MHLLDVPGSNNGKMNASRRECSRKSRQKSLRMTREDEVINECTETPLKERKGEYMSENERRRCVSERMSAGEQPDTKRPYIQP